MRRLALFGATLSLVLVTSAGAGTAQVPRTRLQRQMDSIVRTWSRRLNANDNTGIAKLFALPATIIQGPYEYRFPRRELVAEWHAGLPCSGRIVRISFYRNTATAVFKLGNRGTSRCDAPPGTLAAARFTIVKGLITVWEQVA